MRNKTESREWSTTHVLEYNAPNDERSRLVRVKFECKEWYTPGTWDDPPEGDGECELESITSSGGRVYYSTKAEKYIKRLKRFVPELFADFENFDPYDDGVQEDHERDFNEPDNEPTESEFNRAQARYDDWVMKEPKGI